MDLRAVSEGGADLVVFGDAGQDARRSCVDYPGTRYVFGFPVEEAPNVSFMQLADNQSSYLAGVAAALKSQTGKIGFVGGADAGFIWPFHAGYEAGARSVDPDIEVIYEYVGEYPDLTGFDDPGWAEEPQRGCSKPARTSCSTPPAIQAWGSSKRRRPCPRMI